MVLVYQMRLTIHLVQEKGFWSTKCLQIFRSYRKEGGGVRLPLLNRSLPGEIEDGGRQVAVATGILVEVVLVILFGFVETAEGQNLDN